MVAVLNKVKEVQKSKTEAIENKSLLDKRCHVMNELDQIQTTIKVTIAAILSDNNIYDEHAKDAGNLVPILEILMEKTDNLHEYVDVHFY